MVLRLPDSWSNWNLEVLVFEERGKPEYPGEKPLAIWIYSPGPWSLVRAIVEQTGRLKSARSTKIYMTIKFLLYQQNVLRLSGRAQVFTWIR